MRWAMSDKPREWPTKRLHERNGAAQEAQAARRALDALLENYPMTQEERMRRYLKIALCLERILRLMAQAGAPVEDNLPVGRD